MSRERDPEYWEEKLGRAEEESYKLNEAIGKLNDEMIDETAQRDQKIYTLERRLAEAEENNKGLSEALTESCQNYNDLNQAKMKIDYEQTHIIKDLNKRLRAALELAEKWRIKPKEHIPDAFHPNNVRLCTKTICADELEAALCGECLTDVREKIVTYGYVREWEDAGSHYKHHRIEIEPPALFEVGERVKIILEKIAVVAALGVSEEAKQ